MGKVTEVIASMDPNDADRLKALWDAAYDDLRVLARSRLRKNGPMTLLDTTSLVNESFLRLSSSNASIRADNRKQFYAYASQVMRSVVVDLARERATAMRGGDNTRVTLDSGVAAGVAAEDDPLKVHEALESLASIEPRLAQIVEMRYFGGLTEAEISEALDISPSTIRRDWEKARALLRTMLSD